jgi:metal transporter CNNM
MKGLTVRDILIPIGDVFALSTDRVIDFKTLNKVIRKGFSRIPVYKGDDRNNMTMLIRVK